MADTAVVVNGCQRQPMRSNRERTHLRLLDACLDQLETAHEKDEVVVSVELSAKLRPIVPALRPGMRISRAINLVLREQERYLPVRHETEDGAEGRPPISVLNRAAPPDQPADSHGPDLPLLTPLPAQLATLRELVRRTREMAPLASDPLQARTMVRRAGALQKLIGEALKGCRLLEREQFELKQEAAEAHLRTLRRAGELLGELQKHPGGRPPKTASKQEEVSDRRPTLHELGIDPHESHRWQRIAGLPLEQFEHHLQRARLMGRELTTAGVLRLASTRCHPTAGGNAVFLQQYLHAKVVIRSLTRIDPAAIAAALGPRRQGDELDDLREMKAWLDKLAAALADLNEVSCQC